MGVYHAQSPDGTLRVIGQTVDGEFRKRVYRSKHFLHTPPAICIEADVFDQLGTEFITLIRVREDERMEYWETPYEVFDKYKIVVDRGFGRQYALPLGWWDVHDKDGNLIRARQMERKEAEKTSEDIVESVREAVKGFRPEFGNDNHIHFLKTVARFEAEARKKKPSKKELERMGKSIISSVQNYKK